MTRPREQDDISFEFNDAHRLGHDVYRWIDVDSIYYRDYNGNDIYLVVERICIKRESIGIEEIDESIITRFPIFDHKAGVLRELSRRLGDKVSVYVLWHHNNCHPRKVVDPSLISFVVKNVDGGDVRVLHGWGEYWDWVDEHRLS